MRSEFDVGYRQTPRQKCGVLLGLPLVSFAKIKILLETSVVKENMLIFDDWCKIVVGKVCRKNILPQSRERCKSLQYVKRKHESIYPSKLSCGKFPSQMLQALILRFFGWRDVQNLIKNCFCNVFSLLWCHWLCRFYITRPCRFSLLDKKSLL